MFSNLSLRIKITLTVLFSCFLCSTAALVVSYNANQQQLHEGIISKSRTILSRLESARSYVATQGGLKNTVDVVLSKYKNDSELTESDKLDVLKQVPIFASMKIGSDEAAKELYQFRVFSDEPRRKENQANAEELGIFKEFEKNTAKKEIITNDGKIIGVYRPVFLSESQGCLTCHGSPETSPWKNGKDILGFKMENWKDGKLHGVFGVISDISVVAKAQADEHVLSATLFLFIWITISSLVAVVIGFIFARRIASKVNHISKSIADGAQQVLNLAQQVSVAGNKLSNTTTQQAEALQETTTAIEQTSAMVSRNSENAKLSQNISIESQGTVEKGKQAVENVIVSIEQIADSNKEIINQIESSNREISEIVTVISEIGNKTKVINDIVFQTKLLSFNASVEAARAGDHGKGFAVVAEEVGNLAQMSGNSAKEISELLESSIKKVQEIVDNTKSRVERYIESGRVRVEEGTKTAHSCGELLNNIVAQVSEVNNKVSEIASASEEQSRGITEINKAMGALDSAAQANNTETKSLSSAAQNLRQQSDELKSLIEDLNHFVEGQDHSVDRVA